MKRLPVLLSAILVPLGLVAQETTTRKAENGVVRLGEYVVESKSAERNLVQNPSLESPALEIATSKVDRVQIELQSSSTLTDALDFAPGILTETRGRKEKSFSSFRGQMYPYPDYAINGVWQREFLEMPYLFPAAAVERVEVLRSSGALMIGPNSGLVGVINIIPRRFDERTTVLETRYGTYDSSRTSFVTGDSTENGYYTVGGNWWSTSGPDDENAAERNLSFFATGGLELADGLRLEAMAFYLKGHRELRQGDEDTTTDTQIQTEQFDPYVAYGGTLRAIVEHSEDASTELTLGYIKRIPHYEYEHPTKPDRKSTDTDWEYSAGLTHSHKLSEENTLRVGLQWNQWVCPDGKRFYTGIPMDVHTFSGFVVDEQNLGRLTLDGGIRYTRNYYNNFTHTTFNIVGSKLASSPVENEWADPTLTATLGARYALTDVAELFAHVALGTVDAPPAATTAVGEELQRETRCMVDFGVKLEHPEWGMVKVGTFLVERPDAILITEDYVTISGDKIYLYANKDVRQYGLEIEARSAKFWDKVDLFAAATFMNSLVREDGDWTDYKEIPDQILTAGVYGEFGPVDVNLFGKYVSRYENKRFAADKQYHDLGDFTDINLTVGYSFGSERQTRVYVALENLLDDEYSTVVGYPDYGFQASVGLRHIF